MNDILERFNPNDPAVQILLLAQRVENLGREKEELEREFHNKSQAENWAISLGEEELITNWRLKQMESSHKASIESLKAKIKQVGRENLGLEWDNPEYDRSHLSERGLDYAQALDDLLASLDETEI